jgi:hypothetical protein
MNESSLGSLLNRHGQRWFLPALLVILVYSGIQYGIKAYHNQGAFNRWRPQVLEMKDGEDISAKYNYPNPPMMGVVLLPFAKVTPGWVGALCWFFFKVGLTVLALHWVFRWLSTPEKPLPLWAKGLTVLLSLSLIHGDLHHGNVNLFILFLIMAALTAFQFRHDLTAGVVLGLAIACKVTPALFVPYFVWKRAWKTLAGCVLGLILFLYPGFVPALAIGWDNNRNVVAHWYEGMVRPFVVENKVTSEHNNQSLPGLVYRLFTHNPSFSRYDEHDQYMPTRYDNVLSLQTWQAQMLLKACMGLFALAVVWSCRTPATARLDWRLAAEFSLVVVGMLLFSERTWKHHCVTLLLPFAVLCYYLGTQAPRPGLRGYLIGTLVLSSLLIASTSTEVLPRDFAKEAQVYGAFVVVYLLLTAALVVLLHCDPWAQVQRGQVFPLRKPADPSQAA